MQENKDKHEHGGNAKDALKNLLIEMKDNDFICDYEVDYAIHDSEYPKKNQFKAPFRIEFQDDEEWILFSTTSIRDRMKEQEWDTANIKRLNEYIKKAYVVVPDGAKADELKKASKYNEEIEQQKRYSVLDGVVTLEVASRFIQDKGARLLAYGSGVAKIGNHFEVKIANIMSNEQNFQKWKNLNKNTDGYFYPLFQMIIDKFGLDASKVESISATTDIPKLATGGNPKTDVAINVVVDGCEKTYTISCKNTKRTRVSGHEYSPERYSLVLAPTDEELKRLLIAFRDAGGIRAYQYTDELTKKMELYGDKLAKWVIAGEGDPNAQAPEIQIAQYILSYNSVDETYSMHDVDEYIELCREDDGSAHFGTLFGWTRKKQNIQLKIKVL